MVKQVFKTTRPKKEDLITAYAAGDAIFGEGDLGTEMFVIHEGEVEIIKKVGGEDRRLTVLGHGDFFGEMSVLEDLPRSATARAVGEVKVLSIDGSTFDQMLRKNPEIAVRMMRKLSRRLRETDLLLREAMGSAETGTAIDVPAPAEAPDATFGPETLHHIDGKTIFRLSAGEETTIGRRDPVTGILPDIDLTPVDDQRSISRRHAKIFRRDDEYLVREEIGTMNGTFVAGKRVETGVAVPFKDGDELRFGLVKSVFRQNASRQNSD